MMDQVSIALIANSLAQIASGETHFVWLAGEWGGTGIVRYHADYLRQEVTFYSEEGENLVLPLVMDGIEAGKGVVASVIDAVFHEA